MRAGRFGLISILTVLIFIFAACSASDDHAAHVESGSENIVEAGGDLRVGITAQPPSIDTHITTATLAQDVARNIYESLVTLNANYQPVPMLAETIEKSEDGTTYTFQLREGVPFHNGEEMTAEDVVASMNRWMEHANSGKAMVDHATFEAEDAYTVVLKLKEPMVDVLDIMADGSQIAAVMPKEVIASAGADGVTEYVGTGPFKFEEWKQDQYIHLSKFDDYQALDTPADGLSGKKEALVENIYFEFVSDPSTRTAGIQTGEYDIITDAPYDHYEQLKKDASIKTYIHQSGNTALVYNKKHGLFADAAFRKAVNAALDADKIMKAAYAHEDLYRLGSGYMNENQIDWFSDAGEEAYNQGDAEKAKRLLQEAGYNGEKVTILLTRDYEDYYNAGVVMKEQLDQIGLNTELDIYDWPTVMERRNDPENWDLLVAGFPNFTTPTILPYLSPHWVGWTDDDEIAELLERVQTSENKEKAKQHWDELQGYVWTEYLPISVYGSFNQVIATTDKVEGFSEFENGVLWNTRVAE